MHKKTEDFVEEEDETSSEDDSEESGRQGKYKVPVVPFHAITLQYS